MLKNKNQLCLVCNSSLFGRKDKRFCSDGCRAIFHHARKNPESAAVKNINKILKTNWKILNEFIQDFPKTITIKKLIELGFKWQYHTHISYSENGECLFCCYDYSWKFTNENLEVYISKISTDKI